MTHPHASLPAEDAARLLAWYVEMGVDLAMAEEGWDRFVPVDTAPLPTASAPEITESPAWPRPREEAAPVPSAALVRPQDELIADARSAASTATSLDELRALLERYDGISLKRSATQLVFSDGNPDARIMLVGEAPGRDEDREGRPFVGRAGQLLDRMLTAIGLDRNAVYIANIVPWRPPGNRTPTPQETELCLPFIRRQIELANPDILILLGGSAASNLTGVKEGILRMRGRWMDYSTGTRTIRALATLHPAYLLRTPLQKRLAWRDFRALKEEIAKL
ncbi:uracil-DNA glycosylase [Terrihabitans sp. B22-R8]|uniref:uracil-DNA glycosylase n=1 Tax=Terrihabitans sp. B22-R8 TaxID=3425128 RepID=UPI00403C95EE